MKTRLAKSVVGVLSGALLLSAALAVYANCGTCGPNAPAAESAVCQGCAAATSGQLCAHCTSHKLDLSEADAKKLETAIASYNEKIAAAQKDLLAKAKSTLGEEKAKKLAASLEKKPKK